MACEILSSAMTTAAMTTASLVVAAGGATARGAGGVGRCGGVLSGSFSTRKSLAFPAAPSGLGRLSNDGKASRLDLMRQRSTANGAVATAPSSCEAQSLIAALTDAEPTSSSQSDSGSDGNNLESWLEASLSDIVRHLPEAPFLQYVKPHRSSGDGVRQRVPEELFGSPENWGPVKQNLEDSAPEGIILVHRLDQESLGDCCKTGGCSNAHIGESLRTGMSLRPGGFSTDVWGLLVHGCRGQCNACYILKTTRMASPSGVLTHFCVSRAKCFGPSLKSQLESTWLLS